MAQIDWRREEQIIVDGHEFDESTLEIYDPVAWEFGDGDHDSMYMFTDAGETGWNAHRYVESAPSNGWWVSKRLLPDDFPLDEYLVEPSDEVDATELRRNLFDHADPDTMNREKTVAAYDSIEMDRWEEYAEACDVPFVQVEVTPEYLVEVAENASLDGTGHEMATLTVVPGLPLVLESDYMDRSHVLCPCVDEYPDESDD